MGLKKKATSGLFWSGIDVVGLNIIRIFITIILARILEPTDFGLIAVLNIFIALSETIMQGGFTTALIRKLNITKEDYSTVFVINFVLSLLIYAIIFVLSPTIANFFDEQSLNDIAKIVGLVVIFHSVGIVQNISLKRNLKFKALAIVNILSTILSGGTGILMAFLGYGVWSLVAQITLKALLSSILLWIFGDLRVQFGFNVKSFRENFSFGYKILLSNIIVTLSTEAYNVVIGKIYNAESLGFFYQAKRLSDFASRIISNVFKNVSFPLLSSIQEKEAKLLDVYLQFQRTIAFITFPLMMLLIIVANPLLTLLLTDKWSESIQYFQLFCLSGMLLPLIVLSGHMPIIKGRSDIYLKYAIIYRGLAILALIITASFGISAMIIGIVIQLTIQFFINMLLVSKLYNLSFLTQIGKLKDIFLVSVVISLITYFMKYFILENNYLLFIQIILFVCLYLSVEYFMKSKELLEIKILLKNLVLKNNNKTS